MLFNSKCKSRSKFASLKSLSSKGFLFSKKTHLQLKFLQATTLLIWLNCYKVCQATTYSKRLKRVTFPIRLLSWLNLSQLISCAGIREGERLNQTPKMKKCSSPLSSELSAHPSLKALQSRDHSQLIILSSTTSQVDQSGICTRKNWNELTQLLIN